MAQIPDLDSLLWKNRVVLLFASSSEDRQLSEQRVRFEAAGKAIAERDLKVFEVVGHSAEATRLQSRFDVKDGRFTLVLIGKDGGRKLKKESVVEPDALFRKIDYHADAPRREAETGGHAPGVDVVS